MFVVLEGNYRTSEFSECVTHSREKFLSKLKWGEKLWCAAEVSVQSARGIPNQLKIGLLRPK